MHNKGWMGLAVVGLMMGCYDDPGVAPSAEPQATVYIATGSTIANVPRKAR